MAKEEVEDATNCICFALHAQFYQVNHQSQFLLSLLL